MSNTNNPGNTKLNPWDLDIRVRERNLRNGTLTEKDVAKIHEALPDLEDQVDTVTLPQPALGGREGS